MDVTPYVIFYQCFPQDSGLKFPGLWLSLEVEMDTGTKTNREQALGYRGGSRETAPVLQE